MSNLDQLAGLVKILEDADTCLVIRQTATDAIEIAARELAYEGEDLKLRLVVASDLLHKVGKVVARAYASAESDADDGDEGSRYEMALVHNVHASVCHTMFRLDVMVERTV